MRAQTRRHVEQLAGTLAAVAATAIAMGVLGGVLSDGEWPWVAATYLRLPQVLVVTVATVVLFVTRWWRTATVSAVVAAGLIVSVVAPARTLTTVPALRGETLRIAVFNTGARDSDITALARTIAAARPDVAVLLQSEDIADVLDARLDGLQLLPLGVAVGVFLVFVWRFLAGLSTPTEAAVAEVRPLA